MPMLDDIAYGLRWAAAFVTGRGATALATAVAVGIGVTTVGTPWLPMIGLALGIPVTAALATLSHDHKQKQLRAHYREEVASTLGIDPRTVTIDHVRTVARGNPVRGLPGNRTLAEAFDRNDRHRIISVAANVLSAIVAAGAVMGAYFFGLPDMLSGPLTQAFPALVGQQTLASAVVLGGTAAVTGLALDNVFDHAGMRMFGYRNPSIDDRIEHMANRLRRGQAVHASELMALVADANPPVAKNIRAYFGQEFQKLSLAQQQEITQQYDERFQLTALTEVLNRGLMPTQELAFAIEGRRSGVIPAPSTLLQAYRTEVQKAREEGIEIPAHASAHGTFIERVPGFAQAQRFVDRVRGQSAQAEGLSHVQRLEQQAALASSLESSKTIH